MDTGGLAHMSYNQHSTGGFAPGNGFSSRNSKGNSKRLSVALPPKVSSISESHVENPTPRTTSRAHLLAGLRTAPKQGAQPASAPYNQQRHQFPQNGQWNTEHSMYRNMPHTAGFTANQYAMQAGQQTYALPQVLAPPSLYEDDDDMDPNVFEQLQLTGLYLAQRQQQLQQQLANITAAANQIQGLDMGMYQHMSLNNLTQQAQEPIPVPGQPGVFIVQNPATGEYQYVQLSAQHASQRGPSPLGRSQTMHNLTSNDSRPVFRAEISPPPAERPTLHPTRSVTPPTKRAAQPAAEHVEPLPPPSANAFRRGHQKKVSSISISNGNAQPSDGPKTSSAATFGSTRQFIPPTPMTGTFGPGAARVGEHPIRQPRGPPPLEELAALPTANHEGSKNFATRRRRRALNNLVRAGSARRGVSNPIPSTTSPTSESGMSLAASDDFEPGYYRKQSPIGSERSAKRGSQSSVDGSTNGSTVQTPATEDINVFDMQSFAKQLPLQFQQGQERRKMMLGVLSAAEKRKSLF